MDVEEEFQILPLLQQKKILSLMIPWYEILNGDFMV